MADVRATSYAGAEHSALGQALTYLALRQSAHIRLVQDSEAAQGACEETPAMALQLRLMPEGLHVMLRPRQGFGPSFDAASTLPHKATAQDLQQGLEDALAATVVMADADRQGPEALRALVAQEATDGALADVRQMQRHINTRSYAIRRVAERKDLLAAQALRAVVQRAADVGDGERATLAQQAVGSLVALCDREATLPIIALAQKQSHAFVAQMAHALAALGGRTAEAYLVTLASGHLHPGVRQEAAAALVDLQRHKKLGQGCG